MKYIKYNKEVRNSKPTKEYKKKYKVIIIAKEIKREYIINEYNEELAQISAIVKFLDILYEYTIEEILVNRVA